MNFKKIIIYQHEILFDILDEIKEKFNFDLIKAEKNNFEQIINSLKTDFLIISKFNISLISSKILNKVSC